MNKSILVGLLALASNLYAEGDNSSIYEEAILPSFAESNYYQSPQVSVDFELDIMLDSNRFGAELKFAQEIGSYFSVVESLAYYSADTVVIDNDKQFLAGAGALFTPFKRRLVSPFVQIDLGYLGWVTDDVKWTGSPFAGHRAGIKLNLTKYFGLLVQRRDMYLTREAPETLQGRVVESKQVVINDVSFVYHVTI